MYNMTERVVEAWKYYDEMLDKRIAKISELSKVPIEKFVKINPAEFIVKNRYQVINGYNFKQIGRWIAENKTESNYLISPLDDLVRTANQISYKEKIGTIRIRGSKCKLVRVHSEMALDFYRRNHRQSLPNLRKNALSWGLIYNGKLVGCMTYDKTDGAVRGESKKNMYELMRLAFAHGYSIAGGASRLQKHCEESLRQLGEKRIFSYSNATINNGKVYDALGFVCKKIDNGQPFAILRNNKIVRLITLHPNSTDKALAEYYRLKSHIGGNRLWTKEI